MHNYLSTPRRLLTCLAFGFGLLAVGPARAALDPALNPPFPRTLNYGVLTSGSLPAVIDSLAPYSGVVVDAATVGTAADAFKDHYADSKALFAIVDWAAKNPDEGESTLTGPALSSIYPGHFLYYQGATVDQQVFALPGATQVHVTQIASFTVGDETLLVPVRVGTGVPIFDPSSVEIVRVTGLVPDVSGDGGNLVVERAQRGTQLHDFPAGYSKALPHVTTPGDGFWRYNLSLDGPFDAQGQYGYQTAADWVAGWLTTRHPAWDALILPKARWQLDAGALGNPGTHGRQPDTNVDGTPDSGYADGVNEFGLGELALTGRVRDTLGGDRAFLVGFDPTSGTLKASPWPGPGGESGLWAERFPEGLGDSLGGDFDSAYARLDFWKDRKSTSTTPVAIVYTQENTAAYGGGSNGNAAFRLGLGAACLLDGWETYTTRPGQPPYKSGLYTWDEYTAGTENRPGWLGYALEPAVRHTEALGGLSTAGQPVGQSGWAVQINAAGASADPPQPVSGSSTAIQVAITGVTTPLPSPGNIELVSPGLGTIAAGMHSIHFRARATFTDTTPPSARNIRVALELTPSGALVEGGIVPVDGVWRDYYLTVTVGTGGARLVFQIGGPRGTFFLDAPEVRDGSADRFSRRFQGGIVLVNGADEPYVFSLPGTYRRIDGTVDPTVNDGATGLTEESVPAHDTRFLIVDTAGPTPTPAPTPTLVVTPSPTPSPSPTATPPPSLTPSPTVTDLPTMTAIPSPSPSPTPSESPTPSLTPSPSATPPPSGDIVQVLLGEGNFTPDQILAMDRNLDGKVDIADLIIVLGGGQ